MNTKDPKWQWKPSGGSTDTNDEKPIDFWKQEAFAKGDMKGSLLETTSFATLFPKYRENYLSESWPTITSILKERGIACNLDLMEGSMVVKTSKHTWDPYAILQARDMLRLLSRGVSVEQASKMFQDNMFCDIIKIGGFVDNKERFVKRRQRLVGPNGATLKAIELLTSCYVFVHGTTVSAMGPTQGLEIVRRIAEDCMKNVHPIYNIKELMIKREVAKNTELLGDDWSRFLPKFKKAASVKRKRIAKKKEYTPFPPPQPLSEIDKQLESGEYFLAKEDRERKKREEKMEQSASVSVKRKLEKSKVFVPPEEKNTPKRAKKDKISTTSTIKNIQNNIIAKNSSTRKGDVAQAEDYFLTKKKK